jgi:hypothetical protein
VICSSGIVFDPVVGGRRLQFGFHSIYQGTAVLYDRQTDSLWLHLTGEAIRGPLAGTWLKPIPTGRHTTFAAWRTAHPDTEVMAQDPVYKSLYFPREEASAGYTFFPPMFPPTIHDKDPRLAATALVYGVLIDGRPRAYPYAALERQEGVVRENVGGREVVVLYDPEGRSAAAFTPRTAERAVRLVRHASGVFRDEDTGSLFDLEGECVSGELLGQRLERLTGVQAEWYGWYALHTDTTLWTP